MNVAGGLHHAMAARAAGFCVYNDPAVAIARLLDQGAQRVAYVDVDVHHGDGVQAAFYDDPRVLTVSLHETPLALFPGTGFPDETGGPGAEGTAVNVAAAARHRRRRLAARLPRDRAVGAARVPRRRCCSPSAAPTPTGSTRWPTCGCRSTASAPPTSRCARWPTSSASGRWVATGGGGYALVEVVPRAWTHLLAVATGDAARPGHR